MSYEKQTWATGDTITAEKLNHMEDGIASSEQIFHLTYTPQNGGGAICNHTAEEIIEAYYDGKYIAIDIASVQVCGSLDIYREEDEAEFDIQAHHLGISPNLDTESGELLIHEMSIQHTFSSSDNSETIEYAFNTYQTTPCILIT